jgi:hypothetical protein
VNITVAAGRRKEKNRISKLSMYSEGKRWHRRVTP